MSMIYALMALCLSGCTLAQVIKSGACPDVQIQEDVNIPKVIGRWYEQARFFALYQFRGECGIFDWVVNANKTMKLVNTLTSTITGKKEVFETPVIVPDPKQSAKLLIKLPLSPIEEYNNFWILGTDYDNWAVALACNEVCSINLQYAWIATRKQNPDESVMQEAYEVFSKNNLQPDQFLPVGQKNCRMDSSK